MGRKSLGQIQGNEQLEQLPVSRIRTIMKSSPEVEGIRKEALFLVNKATEYFIQFLASTANARSQSAHELDYDYLSEVVRGDKRLTFMADLFPKRITYKEYKEIIARKRKEEALKAREALLKKEQEKTANERKIMKIDQTNSNQTSPSKPDGSPRTSSDFSDTLSTNSETIKYINSSNVGEDQEGKQQDSQMSVGSECDDDDEHDTVEGAVAVE